VAEHDGVRSAQDAEQRAAAATVLVRALDQSGDLDQLHEDAAYARQRRHRPRGRERVVTSLDLHVRERLQQRRLAGIRRSHERDLSGSFAPHGDRVAVHDPLA